ncbi:MAG: serine/threonine protein kinase, partial [Bradymonadaceae bacterium]
MGKEPKVVHKATLVVGDFIERKYRISRLLDEGGMGCVYHAVHEPLGRDVAVKVLKPITDEEPEKREQRHRRFLREASLSSRLNHPNTITIFDYGELDDNRGFFFVMEFLEGMSLRDLLSRNGALPVDTALHIATQIAGSLSDAHEAGVIHRDLKPPNVMLVSRGGDSHFVKVVDFGLVKDISEDSDDDTLTAENTFVGSPLYMAPERFLSKNADSPSVDIYALGVVLYEMLAGRPPFLRDSASTLHQLIMQHIQSDPPPMRSF